MATVWLVAAIASEATVGARVGCRRKLRPEASHSHTGGPCDHHGVAPDDAPSPQYEPPRIPASAGALIFDAQGRLLILKPNYKKGWTIPGGQIDANGESPWDACRRETREESGLEVIRGRLACVDFLTPKPDRPGGMRFLFDCGTATDRELAAIRLDPAEIDAYELVTVAAATAKLSGPIRRRVVAAMEATQTVYLENGRPLPSVQN